MLEPKVFTFDPSEIILDTEIIVLRKSRYCCIPVESEIGLFYIKLRECNDILETLIKHRYIQDLSSRFELYDLKEVDRTTHRTFTVGETTDIKIVQIKVLLH